MATGCVRSARAVWARIEKRGETALMLREAERETETQTKCVGLCEMERERERTRKGKAQKCLPTDRKTDKTDRNRGRERQNGRHGGAVG